VTGPLMVSMMPVPLAGASQIASVYVPAVPGAVIAPDVPLTGTRVPTSTAPLIQTM